MEPWSSIRNYLLDKWDALRVFYRLHPAYLRYTWAGLFLISAAATQRWAAALVILAAIGVLMLFDRWGESWLQRGRQMLNSKPGPKP
ncbi:MAG: hypothetical protein V4662_01320 [Verrucomicrobiota bacterium]